MDAWARTVIIGLVLANPIPEGIILCNLAIPIQVIVLNLLDLAAVCLDHIPVGIAPYCTFYTRDAVICLFLHFP